MQQSAMKSRKRLKQYPIDKAVQEANIQGMVRVEVPGRTQEECEYIVKTVVKHLPVVKGLRGRMHVHVVQRTGAIGWYSVEDEFENVYPQQFELDGTAQMRNVQDEYLIILEGNMYGLYFNELYRLVQKWLCRLAKRLSVQSVLIRLDGRKQATVINSTKYGRLLEETDEGVPTWIDYLMWQPSAREKYHIRPDTAYTNKDTTFLRTSRFQRALY